MERTLSEKLAVLQSQRELSRSATPAREEQTDTQTSLLKLSQDVLALKGSLEIMQASSGADVVLLSLCREASGSPWQTCRADRQCRRDWSVRA